MRKLLPTMFLCVAGLSALPALAESSNAAKVNPMSAPNSVNWQHGGGWGMGCSYCQGFDIKNSVTVSGTVEKVEVVTPTQGMSQGVHLILKTKDETLSVHAGPSWFIENQDVKIAEKDSIKVTGIKTKWNDNSVIIAFEIEKNGDTLVLREKNGRPMWMGWRRGPMHGRMR